MREADWSLNLITPATDTVVTLAEAKAHCRVTNNAEDALIEGKLAAAQAHCENWCRRSFLTQSWALQVDRFPCGNRKIVLLRPPLQTVTEITYIDGDGLEQTLAADQYQVIADRSRPMIAPAYGVAWPITRDQPRAVTIGYDAGYGTPEEVPAAIRAAVLIMTAHLVEQRTPVVTGTIATPIPLSAQALMGPYRVVFAGVVG
jgi:uncharacterized phiE125 gp8 family phage protein